MPIPERVQRWRAAWEGADAGAVAALYTGDATHASAGVAALTPDAARSGRGR